MDILTIILIAIGLSMDSFVVSLTNGLIIKNLNIKKILLITLSLSIFQGLMPLIGWFAGVGLEKYITEFDHWISFLLLAFIGIKMIYDGLTKKDVKKLELKTLTLLGQSFATSVDAFVVGISFALLNLSIVTPVLIIVLITFIISLIGLQLGKYFSKNISKYTTLPRCRSWVEVFGGVLLFGIGLKILIEHLCF